MDSFKVFCDKYGGCIIGGLIGIALSIILFCTNLYNNCMYMAWQLHTKK